MTEASTTLAAEKTRFPITISPARVHATVIQLVLVVMIVLAAIFVPHFLSATNISAILYAGAPVGIVAIGLALITMSGNLFVLSLAATAALASITFAMLSSGNIAGAILLTLLIGALVGILQGVVVVSFRSNPIITSIAAASLIGAAAEYLSSGRTILIDANIGWLGNATVLPGIPFQALIFVVLALILEIIMERTRTGRELRLTGMNKAAANLAGIRTSRAAMLAYLVAGIAAAAAGIMIAAQAGAGNLRVAQDMDFSAIAAVLIGGIGINGGRGRVLDAAVGAIFVAVLTNILLVNGFSYEVQLMVKGLAVIGSVMLGAALSTERN